MKELISILTRNKAILLLVLLSFTMTEVTRNIKLFTVAGILLFFWASGANLKLLKQNIGRFFLIVFIFLVYYISAVTGFSLQYLVHNLVPTCVLFMIGNALVQENQTEKRLLGLVFIVSLCCGINNIVFTINDAMENGWINYDFLDWEAKQIRDDDWVATSLRAAELAPLLSCVVMVFIPTNNDSQLKQMIWLGGILSVVALICNLHFVSRSALVVFMVCALVGCVFIIFQGKRKNIWLLLLMGIAVLWFVNSGFWDMMNYKNEISEVETGNGRTDTMKIWWNLVLEHPYGVPNWYQYPRPFAHNFWLDFAKIAGWVPAIGLALFSLLNIRDVYRVCRSKNIPSSIKLLVLSMTIAFILAFSVEPIFEGTKNGMYSYFFFCGIVSALANIKHPIILKTERT